MKNISGKIMSSNKLKRTTVAIAVVASIAVSGDKAGASLTDMLLGSPVWSVPCSTCTQSEALEPQITLHQPFAVTSAVWSPNGKYLSVGSGFEGNINVYDTSNWTIVSHLYREMAGNDNSVIQFTPDSQSLLMPRIKTDYGYNVAMEIWNVPTSKVLDIYYSIFQSEASQSVYNEAGDSRAKTVAVSQDYVAGSVGGNNNGYVLVFSKKYRNILQRIECARYNVPDSISFSIDQSELIVGGCHLNEVEAYSVENGRMIFQTQITDVWIFNFTSYCPSGSLIAIGSSDSGSGTITLLKADDGSIAETLPRELATITNMQWLNDHLILISYDGWHPGGSVAIIWDINSKSIAAEFGGKHLQLASISPDGHQLAAIIGNDVYIGNLQNMNPGN